MGEGNREAMREMVCDTETARLCHWGTGPPWTPESDLAIRRSSTGPPEAVLFSGSRGPTRVNSSALGCS